MSQSQSLVSWRRDRTLAAVDELLRVRRPGGGPCGLRDTINDAICGYWGRMSALRPIPVIDGLLAATAVVHDRTLVTRNDRDIIGLGATELDLFEPG